eukprot:COSAG01_NODE_423_length_17260_cov_203.736962_11_plen_62_part_00
MPLCAFLRTERIRVCQVAWEAEAPSTQTIKDWLDSESLGFALDELMNYVVRAIAVSSAKHV